MRKIIQLSDDLANKIAAGEVVERPASVVKELTENAIDANSTIIEIEIEEAGLRKIRVVDNGSGIREDDAIQAFERHATSKIKDENDLFRIRSLGFRGEALPSIASVAKVDFKTCTGDCAGTRLLIEGSQVVSTEKCSSRQGTDITVTDLFFNTPARLKYMRSLHTELGNITDIVNRLALAHPEISFKLSHNGKLLLQTNGNGDSRQVIAAIYGINVAKKMIPISANSLDFEIEGYISLPEVSRASRNYLSLMINGRFIKSYQLANAISEGYHTLLPIGRHPIVLLNIKMDPILVDVNVHPTKLEVRISKEKELQQIITDTIKNAFKKHTLIPTGTVQSKSARREIEQPSFQLDHLTSSDNINHIEQPNSTNISEEVGEFSTSNETDFKYSEEFTTEGEKEKVAIKGKEIALSETSSLSNEQLSEDFNGENKLRVPPLYPIGQMHGTYIFAQNEQGLYMIDQHAAQERIKYEFYKEKLSEVTTDLQQLLVPLTLQYSADQHIKIEQYKNELRKFGVFLEPFGHNSYIVREHPSWFPNGKEQETIETMIEQIISNNKIDIMKLREEAAIMMSCKASIKANRHLRNDEITALLDELRQTTDPFTCPHGRPIIIHYSTYELEKMFKRVM